MHRNGRESFIFFFQAARGPHYLSYSDVVLRAQELLVLVASGTILENVSTYDSEVFADMIFVILLALTETNHLKRKPDHINILRLRARKEGHVGAHVE